MFDFLLIPFPWLALPLLILGFLPLIKGADWLVDGAASLAKRLDIPPLVIGLTVVAFGTSTPELVVNVLAAVAQSTDIAFGNIVGSNIANILLILGASSLLAALPVQRSTLWIEIPLVILVGLVLWAIAADRALEGGSVDVLGRIDGILLLILFVFFFYYNVDLARRGTEEVLLPEFHEVEEHVKPLGASVAGGLIVMGLILVMLGGKMVVEGAVAFARMMNIADRIIGLTIVSVGTSLPELATSVVAAWKKQVDIAVGNVVGSNLFNVLMILGLTAVITPVPVAGRAHVDLAVNLGVTLLLWVLVMVSGSQVQRWHGALFLLMYGGYVFYLLAS